uniref:Nicotinate-nucleotide pyrophosphorylase [carboxylating] n=1 Tax=Phaeomonas parva TaxID=124430 RepID=A0A6U4F908_9STRA|mmetsp:Transcript_24337/g.76295  ORF Transcript_24337/g.76295 Transcript_24337/m.76295 type:complete len:335 (+) Transcript_24337:111-1115(+)|eukprot:CAMPEP_0118878078 /NCGR_PEP_ID=MMETSP1163-20130328/18127_1 /TAXON_ID=124430 /ORGANISM="Phaeomonas parva, Strain CCMP2877" /LENGTH=334 /DNA_ID=CAMNT_0006813865 /DNA_START=144 /DNA_END=1148 /DNA_ORIENTATION=+
MLARAAAWGSRRGLTVGAAAATAGVAALWQQQPRRADSAAEVQPQLRWAHVLPLHWKSEVAGWLQDDMPSLDIGGFVVGEERRTAHLYGKSNGVLAGRPFFDAVFELLGCEVEWHMREGAEVDADAAGGKVHVATVTGPARHLLIGERTALNTLARCSGVATKTRDAVAIKEKAGWHGMVAGTRKTTPGFRIVEKYGLLVGGGATHRLDLSQMIMLKDNHIWSAGSITKAVQAARSAAGFTSKIEVEARDLTEAVEAAEAGADIVMLDNYTPAALQIDARALKARFPHVVVEASGGITEATMADYMCEHVDVISRGNLTQGYPAVDFSLKIQKE